MGDVGATKEYTLHIPHPLTPEKYFFNDKRKKKGIYLLYL